MNENDLARRIVSQLEQGLADIPSPVANQLAAARHKALEHYRAGTRQSGMASAVDWLRGWVAAHGVATRVAVPALFATIAAVTVFYLQSMTHHDAVEVEAALLADELPIHAYTDPGFDAWLRHTSHEQQ
ncbi:MAG: DUF3619 family protein [Burkholderiales bacterium]